MFFPNKLVSLPATGKVLEVGPGGHPHPRSDVLLEKEYADEDEAFDQRGCQSAPPSGKPLHLFDGRTFPFAAQEFSYAICSHVLEHVEDVDAFCSELFRVAPAGYIEFPTVFYDFLYNFPSHRNLLFFREETRTILWVPKTDVGFDRLKAVQRVFYESLRLGMEEIIWQFTPLFVQGFEFQGPVSVERVPTLDDLLRVEPGLFFPPRTTREKLWELALYNYRKLRKIWREART